MVKDREAWDAAVHGVTKSCSQLIDWTTTKLFILTIMNLDVSLEKAMAPHSSTLAWKIPRMEEPGRLQTMGSRRVGHDWATSLSLFPFMHWRRKWQPTPVFLPGESQGWGSLVGRRLWGSHRVGHDWSDLAAAAAAAFWLPFLLCLLSHSFTVAPGIMSQIYLLLPKVLSPGLFLETSIYWVNKLTEKWGSPNILKLYFQYWTVWP